MKKGKDRLISLPLSAALCPGRASIESDRPPLCICVMGLERSPSALRSHRLSLAPEAWTHSFSTLFASPVYMYTEFPRRKRWERVLKQASAGWVERDRRRAEGSLPGDRARTAKKKWEAGYSS